MTPHGRLATLADVAQVVGAGTVVGGVVFAVVQIRQLRREQREAAAMAFMESIQTPVSMAAFRTVLALPDGLSAEEIRSRGPDVEEAVAKTSWTLEAVGVMVFLRMLDLCTVYLLIGGFEPQAWSRVSGYLEDERRRFRGRT